MKHKGYEEFSIVLFLYIYQDDKPVFLLMWSEIYNVSWISLSHEQLASFYAYKTIKEISWRVVRSSILIIPEQA